MKTLTKDEAIRLHRKMWRWIAEETEKQGRKVSKWEYFKAMGIDENDVPTYDCYCCEVVDQQINEISPLAMLCDFCPLDWGFGYETGYRKVNCLTIEYPYVQRSGYFRRWVNTKSPKEAAELARTIAELPEKEANK